MSHVRIAVLSPRPSIATRNRLEERPWRGAPRLVRLMGATTALVMVMAGCGGRATTLEGLTERAVALRDEVTTAGRVTEAQQQAFDELTDDIEAWNASTGRFDIMVAKATTVTPCTGGTVYSARAIQAGDRTCTPNCPFFPPNRPEGYFCLPDGHSCDPVSGTTVCSYRCVKIPFANLRGASGAAPRSGA